LTKAQKRKLAIVIVLAVLIVLLGSYFAYYKTTRKLTFNVLGGTDVEVVQPPQFLYSFSGTTLKLQRPVGVFVDGNTVYTCDSAGRQVLVFDQAGNYKRSFGASQTVIPLNVARSPKSGELYVTDRRMRSIMRFDLSGKYLGDFNPKLPKSELPAFQTDGVQWAPVALAFAPDGTLFVTDILKASRVLIFGPDGKFMKSFGDTGMVNDVKASPGLFQYPNGIVYHKGLVYITDSNNRRVQVFDKNGTFKQIIATQGLPRGIDFLQSFPGDKATSADRMVVIDTLSHDATIWTSRGDKVVNFGQQGVLDGQFSYPNGCAIAAKNKIFIADTSNGRIQVWGWPDQLSPVPLPQLGGKWWVCLLPLLLLPLLLLRRRKRVFATEDFIVALVDAEELDVLTRGRRRWLVTEADYEALKGISQGEVDLATVLEVTHHSESDAKDMVDRLEVDAETAIVLSIAKRIPLFATESVEYRRLAKSMQIDVVNREEFLRRFEKRASSEAESAE
jgi:DNA-binding beta-propeller fold protein YncE